MSKSSSDICRPADVLERVHAAFGKLEVPSPDEIIGGRSSVQDASDSEEWRAKLAGVAWTDLDADFLEVAWASFCYLSPTGYRYYLPALLKESLANWQRDKLVHSTVFG